MPSLFRPSTPADAPEVGAFCRRFLQVREDNPMFSPEHMAWKYWQTWPDWTGSRSYVLLRDERIVAHGAVLPLVFERAGRRFCLVHLFDWASDPDAIGSGASLLKRIAALADGMLIVGGSALTQRMAGPLGFRQLPAVTRHVFGTDAASPHTQRGLGVPDLLEPPAPKGYSARRASPVDALTRTHDVPAEGVRFRRSSEMLSELSRCPAAPMEVYAASKGGSPLGGFVLSSTPAQTRLAAFWAASTALEDWVALLQLACREARSQRPTDELVCMTNAPLELSALAAAGFVECGSVPMFVLAPAGVVAQGDAVAFQMLDGDVAFLHQGQPESWA